MRLPLAVMLYYLRDYSPVVLPGRADGKYIDSFQLLTGTPSFWSRNICYICGRDILEKSLKLTSGNIFFCICEEECDLSELSNLTASEDQNTVVLFSAKTVPSEILNRMIFIYTSLVQWDKECHQRIIEGCSLQELMQLFGKISCFPAAVFQPDFRMIGYTEIGENAPKSFRALIRLGQTPDSLMPEISRQQIPLCLKNNEKAIYMPSAENPSLYYIYRKHQKDREVVAYSCIFCPLDKPDQDFLELAELFLQNIDFYFKNNEKYDKLGNYMYEGLLEKFLADRQEHLNPDVLSQMEALRMPVRGNFLLIQIELENGGSSHLTYIRKLLYDGCRRGKPFLFRDTLYLLCPLEGPDKGPKGALSPILREIRETLFHYKCVCFVSNPFSYMPGIYDARQQCAFLNEICPRIKKSGTGYYLYEDYTMYHLFASLEERMDLSAALPPDFLRFWQWNSRFGHSGDKILRVYLEQNLSFRKCADLLNIHRNTAEYQIRKIEKALDLDFSDHKIRQQFLLAFQIMDYLDR